VTAHGVGEEFARGDWVGGAEVTMALLDAGTDQERYVVQLKKAALDYGESDNEVHLVLSRKALKRLRKVLKP
jgi:hypothetical protein